MRVNGLSFDYVYNFTRLMDYNPDPLVLQEDREYSLKELADWFGINKTTIIKNRDKYLEYLDAFAEWEPIGKTRVKIKNVFIERFDKDVVSNYNKIKVKLDDCWNASGLDTCSRVAKEMERSLDLAPSTIYKYVAKSRTELYGKPFFSVGEKGSCVYLWCKKQGEGAEAVYTMLTPEEEKIKQSIIQKYYGDLTEKNIIVQGMVAAGEISKEEAWDLLTKLTDLDNGDKFFCFISELQSVLQATLVRGTLVSRKEEGAWLPNTSIQ